MKEKDYQHYLDIDIDDHNDLAIKNSQEQRLRLKVLKMNHDLHEEDEDEAEEFLSNDEEVIESNNDFYHKKPHSVIGVL